MSDFYVKLVVKKGTGDDPCASDVSVKVGSDPATSVTADATGATFFVPLPSDSTKTVEVTVTPKDGLHASWVGKIRHLGGGSVGQTGSIHWEKKEQIPLGEMAPAGDGKALYKISVRPAHGKADQPLDAQTALLFSPKAPLAGTTVTDHSAVWACVPAGFDGANPTLLVYFHGHNYFVTAMQGAGKVIARAPDWLSGNRLTAATNKGTAQGPAGTFYKFDALASGSVQPLVLLPEDGSEDATYDPTMVPDPTPKDPDHKKMRQQFWARENDVGTLATPSTLGDLLDDCLDRLGKLSPSGGSVTTPGTGSYLAKLLKSTDLRRLFLTGHSGGGVPLFTACSKSTLALGLPTSLWVFDATYSHPAASVRKFCETWDGKSKLGMGKDDSRVVILYNPASDTDTGAIEVRNDLKNGGPGGTGTKFTVKELDHNGAKDLPAVESALKASPILFIKTNVAHDSIPQTFTPILLRNA